MKMRYFVSSYILKKFIIHCNEPDGCNFTIGAPHITLVNETCGTYDGILTKVV